MEHSKEFYESVIRVIELFEDGNEFVSCEKGYELAGNYWPAVVELFKENHAVCVYTGGHIQVTYDQYLDPLYEDCKNHLKSIQKAEYDRNLANEESRCNIKYGKKGYDLAQKSSKWAKASIVISAIVAAGQLTQWTIMLLQYLRQ